MIFTIFGIVCVAAEPEKIEVAGGTTTSSSTLLQGVKGVFHAPFSFSICDTAKYYAEFIAIKLLKDNFLLEDFKEQIIEGLSKEKEKLFSQQPFEPDNLLIDCVFCACCNVLLLHNFLNGDQSKGDKRLELLVKLAFLTYVRHNASFFSSWLTACGSLFDPPEPNFWKTADKVMLGEFYRNVEKEVKTCQDFSIYKEEIIKEMVAFVKCQTGIEPKITYETVPGSKPTFTFADDRFPLADQASIMTFLVNTVKKKTGGLIIVERSFGNLDLMEEDRGSIKIFGSDGFPSEYGVSYERCFDVSNDGYLEKWEVKQKTRAVQKKVDKNSTAKNNLSSSSGPNQGQKKTKQENKQSDTQLQPKEGTEVSENEIGDSTEALSATTTSDAKKDSTDLKEDQPVIILMKPIAQSKEEAAPVQEFFKIKKKSNSHLILTSIGLLEEERADDHAIVGSKSLVLGNKNIWFRGKKGLTPTDPTQKRLVEEAKKFILERLLQDAGTAYEKAEAALKNAKETFGLLQGIKQSVRSEGKKGDELCA
jgi:hypothetical protein